MSTTPTPAPDVAAPRPASRPGTVGGVLAVAAIALIALNLRPGATSLGPLMERIVDSYGEGGVASGLLTALPCLAFGILGFIAVPIGRRMGLTGAVVASFVLVVIGLLLRPYAGSFGLFLGLSMLALIGPALGNVLVPAWIKQHGGARVVLLTTIYTVTLAIGGTAGSVLAVPLAGDAAEGWRHSLQLWGMVAVVPVVLWAIVLTRTGHDFPPAPPGQQLRGSLLRSPTAIALTVMFGLQSMNAYTQFGLLPQVLTSSGVDAVHAGVIVGSISAWGIVGGFLMPVIVARAPGLPWICAALGLTTAVGYLGLWLAPGLSPYLWAAVLGIGGMAFPTAIALIPARSRSAAVTARLSGLAQPLGYILAAVGPIVAGALLDATGSIPAMLALMAATGLLLAVAGFLAGRHRMVDDEMTPSA